MPSGGKVKDLVGRTFGRLKVESFNRLDRRAYWNCVCSCGEKKVVHSGHLITGNTSSCGCLDKESRSLRHVTHGECDNPLYNIWGCMKKRCLNSNDPSYPRYGGRGITLCKEWYEFQPFYDWAIENGYKAGLTIERKLNDEGYAPANCIWATTKVQARNRRNTIKIVWEGEEMPLVVLCELKNIDYHKVSQRLFVYKWELPRAILTP